MKSQPLNSSVLIDEEDASTADQDKLQYKTEITCSDIPYAGNELREQPLQMVSNAPISVKIGRMTITTPAVS